MKSFKLLLAALFVSALATPMLAGGVVHAQVVSCNWPEENEPGLCDLSVTKEVSINGGAFVDANSSAEAAQATVGDSVVWQVMINNTSSPGGVPYGEFLVGDILPAGVSYVSSSASLGSYDNSAGTWTFTFDLSTSSYPVTLTINSTATTVGEAQNIALLSGYACETAGEFCSYSDDSDFSEDEESNDGDEAWAEISAPPVVLGDSTPVVLAATGSGTIESLVAAALIGTTLLTLGYSRFARK